MSAMDRARFDDLKDAYALGALTPGEFRDFEEYLAVHPELQPEVDDALQISALLALSPPEHDPSSQLRDAIMRTVSAEARPREDRVTFLDRLRSALAPRPLAFGVASLIVVALVSWNVALQSQMTELHRENSTLMAEVEQMTGQPVPEAQLFAMEGTGRMSGVEAEVVRTQDDEAVLIANGMPELGDDQTYQMWVISGDDVRPDGVFDPDGETVAAVLESPLDGADTVAVTVEPDGGSPQPTSSPELTAEV